jgi:hypothetical protein
LPRKSEAAVKTAILAIAVLVILVLSCTTSSTANSQDSTAAPAKSLFAAKRAR